MGIFIPASGIKTKTKMAILTQLPIGTKFRIKETGAIVTLVEIRNFPTRYKTANGEGKIEYYKTFEVEVVEISEDSE